jgi:hypothetical protein
MLQLWLRCGLISSPMLSGWAGMLWAGISGTTFRNFLGRLLCRLRLLWGESLFNFCTCICYLYGSGFFAFLLLLYVGWFGFMVLLWWVVFFTMVSVVLKLAGLLHVHVICFHQIVIIAFIKLRHPLSFCRANCAEPWYLCVFVSSLSKNENNNGFDTIGLNSYLFDYKRVANIHCTVVFRIVFPSCLF